jgi:flagellar assembly protein FliH
MSLSEQSVGNTFQAASWRKTAAPGQASRLGESSPFIQVKSQRPGIEMKKKTSGAREFVSPYLSEEKLRRINAGAHMDDPEPESLPDPEAIQKEAYEKGFAQGEAAGRVEGQAEGRRRANEIVVQMERILSEISALWPTLIANYERQLLDLVFRVAERVVFSQIETDHEVVKRVILNAFSIIPEPVAVVVEVNPKDYEYIETIKEDFFHHVGSLKDISVSASPSVGRGGCCIRTRSGEVDAGLGNRLEAVKRLLLETNGKTKND